MCGLQKRLKVTRKDLPEIVDYLNQIMDDSIVKYYDIEVGNYNFSINNMVTLFHIMPYMLQRDGDDDLCENKETFLGHVKSNLLDEDESQDHITFPVYLYIKPTMVIKILLRIMLSMGWFATYINLTICTTVH